MRRSSCRDRTTTSRTVEESALSQEPEEKDASADPDLQRISLNKASPRYRNPREEAANREIAAHNEDSDENRRSLAKVMLGRLMVERKSEPKLEKILEIPEKKTLLLPIVVPEQMHPEVRELRLRLRYAVVGPLKRALDDSHQLLPGNVAERPPPSFHRKLASEMRKITSGNIRDACSTPHCASRISGHFGRLASIRRSFYRHSCSSSTTQKIAEDSGAHFMLCRIQVSTHGRKTSKAGRARVATRFR